MVAVFSKKDPNVCRISYSRKGQLSTPSVCRHWLPAILSLGIFQARGSSWLKSEDKKEEVKKKKKEERGQFHPWLPIWILPCRPDNIWTVPRFRHVIGERRIRLRCATCIYYIGGEVAIAAVYRRNFMAGRFTFAVPRRTENHVHIPRGINNSSVSIRVEFIDSVLAM